jgi:hypothetical protein
VINAKWSALSKPSQTIYSGLATGMLTVAVAAQGGKPAQQVTLQFDKKDNKNCYDNVQGFNWLKDGITRAHPGGYAALINAALANGVGRVEMTSCWRPMLGSVVHRVGLGLDVGYLDKVRLNRKELITGIAVTADADANVSADEIKLYRAHLAAKKDAAAAKTEAKRIKNKTGSTKEELDAANAQVKADAGKAKIAQERWQDELNKNDPPKVKAFRKSLYACTCVAQLFDPWYMDSNTRDQIAPTPNAQIDGNEKLHHHHLHITVADAKVLP